MTAHNLLCFPIAEFGLQCYRKSEISPATGERETAGLRRGL